MIELHDITKNYCMGNVAADASGCIRSDQTNYLKYCANDDKKAGFMALEDHFRA